MARPRVAVGGRWLLLEEENGAVAAQLRESSSEAAALSAALAATRQQLQAEHTEAGALARQRDLAVAEASENSEELASLRSAYAELATAGARAEALAEGRGEELEAAASLRCSLEQSLESSRAGAASQAERAAKTGRRLGSECEERREAEARWEALSAELATAEGHLINRGTHVDLLLRDKQRLWEQLARARREPGGGSAKATQDLLAPRTPSKASKKSTASASAEGGGGARERSASTPVKMSRPGLSPSSPPASMPLPQKDCVAASNPLGGAGAAAKLPPPPPLPPVSWGDRRASRRR
mmetsp:Transcript_56147/g.159225  ORF Transcript_56147/g.159225 Transcript_56147/m.159225 type:complete len:299 (-) Transcript_56147:23-919(-)